MRNLLYHMMANTCTSNIHNNKYCHLTATITHPHLHSCFASILMLNSIVVPSQEALRNTFPECCIRCVERVCTVQYNILSMVKIIAYSEKGLSSVYPAGEMTPAVLLHSKCSYSCTHAIRKRHY